MNKNLYTNKSSEKGVSLLITFFVMSIALAIVLGISIILLSEMTVIRGVGYSVSAFYAADTGIEKTFYYDRKKLAGEVRGICNICNSCATDDCMDCTTSPNASGGCDVASCTDCTIEYNSVIGNESFGEKITISSSLGDIYESYGIYRGVSRAVRISGGSGTSGNPVTIGPTIINTQVVPRSVPEGLQLTIDADITPYPGKELNSDSLMMRVQSPDDNDLVAVILENISGDTYEGIWTGPVGVYYVDIIACDTAGNCTVKDNI